MNLREALGVARRARQPRDRRRVPTGADRARATRPTLDRIRALTELLGSPAARVSRRSTSPGTNGKTSVDAHDRVAARRDRPARPGSYTSPHLERVQRAHRRGTASRSPTTSSPRSLTRVAGDRGVPSPSRRATSRSSPPPRSTGSPTSRSTSRWSRSGSAARGTPPTSSTPTVAVVTNVSSTTSSTSGRPAPRSPREKAGIVEPGATLVLGETDPGAACRSSRRASRRASCCATATSAVARATARARRTRCVDLYTPEAEYDEVFLPLHGAHQADNAAIALAAAEAFLGRAARRRRRRTRRSPDVRVARAARGGRAPTARAARRRAQRRRRARAASTRSREEFAPSPRTLVVGLLREKEPHEMLDALGVDDARRSSCAAARRARARSTRRASRRRRSTSASTDERIDVVDSFPRPSPGRSRSRPPDGQIVVTGSLYVVGAARSRPRPPDGRLSRPGRRRRSARRRPVGR